eukprot:scaffold36285_cov119-Isochrysis_galbana.AAC.1
MLSVEVYGGEPCFVLWKRLHQYVKANPSRTALFDHTKGASPPTKCVVVAACAHLQSWPSRCQS